MEGRTTILFHPHVKIADYIPKVNGICKKILTHVGYREPDHTRSYIRLTLRRAKPVAFTVYFQYFGNMTGVFYHSLFRKHLEGYGHVERPERVAVILDSIKKSGLSSSVSFIEALPAEREWLYRVHNREYVDRILDLEIKAPVILDWGDTVATPATPQAALHAAGCGVQAARMVFDNQLSNAFCAVRPPGHHAEADRAMGFCIFNNIAVAAAHLTEEIGLKRVAIIDWDVHHGNGTEKIFVENDRILYISLHQYPHYPGTGPAEMTGKGPGRGYTLNLPMGADAGDREYLQAFDHDIIPALEDFRPEFILISAGFDAHIDDPLSGIGLTTDSYRQMTKRLVDCAGKYCRGKIVSLLEGGYNLAALADSVTAHLEALTGNTDN